MTRSVWFRLVQYRLVQLLSIDSSSTDWSSVFRPARLVLSRLVLGGDFWVLTTLLLCINLMNLLRGWGAAAPHVSRVEDGESGGWGR